MVSISLIFCQRQNRIIFNLLKGQSLEHHQSLAQLELFDTHGAGNTMRMDLTLIGQPSNDRCPDIFAKAFSK